MTQENNSNSERGHESESRDISSKLATPSVVGATPADGAKSLYQGQKVALTVDTTSLKENNYTTISFLLHRNDDFTILDQLKAGLMVHPDNSNNQVPITDSDTYAFNAVVFGKASQSDFAFCRWNVEVDGGSQGALTLNGKYLPPSSDYGYETNAVSAGALYGLKQIPGNTTTFDASKAVVVNGYQIFDKNNAAIKTETFSACITSKNGLDLTNFDFWDATHKKLSKVSVDGKEKYVWVDSDGTGQFTFYVTSPLPTGIYSDTLVMMIGNESPEIAQVIVGDLGSVDADSNLPAPQPDGMTGSELRVPPSMSIVPISIPQPLFPGGDGIQAGDMLVLRVNGVALLNSFVLADHGISNGGYPDCFLVPASALSISGDGASNVLDYIVLRDSSSSALSSEFPFVAYGDSSSGIQPFPPTKKYQMPVFTDGLDYTDIDFTRVEKGLGVKISWENANWAPASGDVLTLSIGFAGWNEDVADNQIASVPFPAISSQDLTNKYATFVVDYKYFAGFVKGPAGQPSKVFMQYQVPDDGVNQAGYSFPTPTMHIDTVPPGGL